MWGDGGVVCSSTGRQPRRERPGGMERQGHLVCRRWQVPRLFPENHRDATTTVDKGPVLALANGAGSVRWWQWTAGIDHRCLEIDAVRVQRPTSQAGWPGHTRGTPHRSTATNDDNRCTAPRRQTAWAALFPQADNSPEAPS